MADADFDQARQSREVVGDIIRERRELYQGDIGAIALSLGVEPETYQAYEEGKISPAAFGGLISLVDRLAVVYGQPQSEFRRGIAYDMVARLVGEEVAENTFRLDPDDQA